MSKSSTMSRAASRRAAAAAAHVLAGCAEGREYLAPRWVGSSAFARARTACLSLQLSVQGCELMRRVEGEDARRMVTIEY